MLITATERQYESIVKPSSSWLRRATLFAVLSVVAGGFTQIKSGRIGQLLGMLPGPPAATLSEAHADNPDGPKFDHSRFEVLLKKHVDEHGWVDYAQLVKDAGELDEYISALARAPFEKIGREEKLALLMNAYNAFTLRLILDFWNGGKLKSIKDIPANKRWNHRRWRVGAYTWSLNQIEHEQIRSKFREPRIHFALVCAAWSCPKLRNEAYDADKLEDQLADQMRYAHAHDRWFRFDRKKNTVYLTKLYDWYGGDFRQVADSILQYAAAFAPPLRAALEAGRNPKFRWIRYDWKLNSRANSGESPPLR